MKYGWLSESVGVKYGQCFTTYLRNPEVASSFVMTTANMPLVEIAIPPGFTPETETLDTLAKEHAVQRYAVERGKVVLYLVKLEERKPLELDIPFRASRAASVTAPASVAYLYYEPEVRTETAPVTLKAL